MRKALLFLSSLALLLTGCNNDVTSETTSSSEISSNNGNVTSQTSSSSDDVIFDNNLVGTWYVNTSSTGVVGINLKFVVLENEKVYFGNQYFSLKGYYENYSDVFLFGYGQYRLVLGYDDDEDDPGIDWAFSYGEQYDFGFARKSKNETGEYDYVGAEWPMDKINTYLSTNGTIPSISSDKYYLDLFNSSLYSCASADIEIRSSSLTHMKEYVDSLIEKGYVFNDYDSSSAKGDTFYIGYDNDKIYTLRIRYFIEAKETHIFVYKYNEEIKS